jgi:hypothetical protein
MSKLDYQEKIDRTFYKISPVSSGTTLRQTTPKDRPDFSIVTYIDDNDQKQFQDAVDIIKSVPGHNFKSTLNLHCTLLSLQGNINNNNLKSVYNAAKEFFEKINTKRLKIEFSLIHPGKWDNNHLTESDGTVIALAIREGTDNKRFMDVTYGLITHINNELNLSLERKYCDTLWCTLGFFNENDFPIDCHICSAFNSPKLRGFNHTIAVTKVEITEFRKKSLDDGKTHYVIEL